MAPVRPGELLIRTGFVILLVLIGAACWLSGHVGRHAQEPTGPKMASLEAREKALASLRRYFNQAIPASRDFLINNHSNAGEIFAQDLRKARAGTAASIEQLRQAGADREQLKAFQKNADDVFALLEQVSHYSARQKAENGYDYLRGIIFPARNAALESLRDLTETINEERVRLTKGLDRGPELLLTWFYVDLGACTLVTLLLGWATLSYRSRLRRESLVKLDEVARARDDMEHLSGKLLKVQEEERRRLSRELHDGIGQTLTALRMEIHQAHMNAGAVTPAGERLARAKMLAEEAVHTVKDISLLLRPPLLDDLGLEPAIAWQTDQFTRRTSIPCRFRSVGLQEMLPDDVKTCVFRVIQEALNNCQKHASPTKVQILIEQKPEILTVQVEDDGAGFSLNQKNAPVRHSGLGILGMRERASMLGGSVSIESAPGKGTRLHLSLPLARLSSSGNRQIEAASPVPAIGPAVERDV